MKKNYRELDNSAKLFPLVICKKYNGTFKFIVTLKKNIKEDLLKKALEITLNEMHFFKVQIKKNFFWYYFKINNNPVTINEIIDNSNNKINFNETNNYLFNISYKENIISIDILHYLCDGIGGKIFVESIINNYLLLIYNKEKKSKNRVNYTIFDEYIANYDKLIKLDNEKKLDKPYKINGTLLPQKDFSLSKINIDLETLKKIIKKEQCTITEYICSMLIYSIKKTNEYNKKTIRICVPIDLRKHFSSVAMNNFFSYMYIESDHKEFNLILRDVKEQFQKKLEINELKKDINKMVNLGTNKVIQKIPIFLKRLIVQIFYWKIADTSTMILSNFGKFDIDDGIIENIESMIEPDPTKLIKCSFCSYKNSLNIIFSSKIKEKNLEKEFKKEINKILKK